jgi:hypothetical protein
MRLPMTPTDSALLRPANSAVRRAVYSSAGFEGFPAIVSILEKYKGEGNKLMRPRGVHMSLNNPIDVHLELAKKDLDVGITDDLSEMTVTRILSLLPGAGSAIHTVRTGEGPDLAKARAHPHRP